MAEEANVDEAITAEAKARNDMEIDLKYEQNTKAYEETTKMDIEDINKLQNRNKIYTTRWRTI